MKKRWISRCKIKIGDGKNVNKPKESYLETFQRQESKGIYVNVHIYTHIYTYNA